MIGDQLASAIYYFRIWKLPDDAVYVSVTPWSKGSSGVIILANILTEKERVSYDQVMSSIPSLAHHGYNSSEYHNSEHLRLSQEELKKYECNLYVCLLLIKVEGEEYTNFDILATSSIMRLREDDQIYDSVKHEEYVYFEFYNPCESCPLSVFLDVLSPTVGGI